MTLNFTKDEGLKIEVKPNRDGPVVVDCESCALVMTEEQAAALAEGLNRLLVARASHARWGLTAAGARCLQTRRRPRLQTNLNHA